MNQHVSVMDAPSEFFYARLRPNYRQWIASLIPTILLGYGILLWPLLYAKSFTADEFTQTAVAAPERSILNVAFFPVLGGIAIVLLLAERARWPNLAPISFAVLIAFWAFHGLSITWAIVPSVAVAPFVVLTLTLAGLFASAAMVDSMERFLKPLFWVMVATMLVNLVSVVTTPAGLIGHKGIYIHKNELGAAAALGVVFALYGFTQKAYWYKLFAIIGIAAWFFILYKSQSKTSLGFAIVAPVLGLSVTLARRYFRIPFTFILAVAIPLLIVALSGGIPDFSRGDISDLVGGDRDFTGRVELWDFAFQQLDGRPAIGFGYNSFWETQIGDASPTIHGEEGFLQKTPNAHNGYVDILLQVGWVGMGLFVMLFFAVAHWITKLTDEHFGTGLALSTLFIFVALHNMLESTWFSTNSANAVIFSLFVMAMIVKLPALRPLTLMRRIAP